jgi:intracellular multiplication protein IcmP
MTAETCRELFFYPADMRPRVDHEAADPTEWMRDNGVALTAADGLDDGAAGDAFSRQLGAAWRGVVEAPPLVQAVCVMAALNARGGAEEIAALSRSLEEIYSDGDAAWAERRTKTTLSEHLADAKLVAAIDRRGGRHAYVNTAAMGVHGWASPLRDWGGGEAPAFGTAMFRWLKGVDRSLWYCLNSVGRTVFFAEGAGAVAHFFAERAVGTPLVEPMVDTAIDALAEYLDEHGIIDLDAYLNEQVLDGY